MVAFQDENSTAAQPPILLFLMAVRLYNSFFLVEYYGLMQSVLGRRRTGCDDRRHTRLVYVGSVGIRTQDGSYWMGRNSRLSRTSPFGRHFENDDGRIVASDHSSLELTEFTSLPTVVDSNFEFEHYCFTTV